MLPESGSAILNKFDSSHRHTEKDPFYGTAVKVPVTEVIVWWRNTKKWIFSWQKTNKRPHGNVNNGQDAVENLFLERLSSEVLFARFVSNSVLWSRCNLTGKTARGIHSQHYTGILLSPSVTELIIYKALSIRLTVDPLCICMWYVTISMIRRSHQICPFNSHLSSFWSVNLRSSNDD